MAGGIIVFGANGSGKSTLGRAVADALGFYYMDVETYHFLPSAVPYTAERSREECLQLMLADIKKHGSFVLSAVTGSFGEEFTSMYRLAVWLSAPLEVRLQRIHQRALAQFGERILEGGDMHGQQVNFAEFVAHRSLEPVENWAQTLSCPILHVDGTSPVSVNVEQIVKAYGR